MLKKIGTKGSVKKKVSEFGRVQTRGDEGGVINHGIQTLIENLREINLTP